MKKETRSYIGGQYQPRLREAEEGKPQSRTIEGYAIVFGVYNAKYLPERVGLVLQSNGEFVQTVSRSLAVMGPLGVTAACLLLMFCSRKAMYPWAISIFTLVLPLLILITNLYPA